MDENEEYDELDAYIDTLINEEYYNLINGDIGLTTCQLFKHDLAKDIVPFASGVFLEFGSDYYLLTASHVVEDWSDANKLFLKYADTYISIAGKACGTEMDKEQKIDSAYIKLKPELIPLLLQYYKFLPFERCLFDAKELEDASYCVFGYPTINKRKELNEVKTFGSAYFLKPAQDKVFSYYSFDFLIHYVLEFIGKAVNIKTGQLEKIKTEHYGLSGCGLWYITIELDEENEKLTSQAFLIGVMTEFRRGKYDCLLANRIELILAMIQKNENV